MIISFFLGTPDWNQIREDIADLIDDRDVVNPSVDDGVQGKISEFILIIFHSPVSSKVIINWSIKQIAILVINMFLS